MVTHNSYLYNMRRYVTIWSLLLGLAIAPAITLLTAQKTLADSDSLESRYARAVMKIEALRRSTYNDIKQKTGGKVPQFNCYSSNLDNLSSDIKGMVKSFCDQSERIVQENNLTFDQFNNITRAITGRNPDKALKKKIQAEMMQIR